MKKETKKPKTTPLEIIGVIEKPRWYDIKCTCVQDPKDVLHKYPIQYCLHCAFQEQENDFKKMRERGQFKQIQDGKEKTITKLTIHRGKKYQEILGFIWQ